MFLSTSPRRGQAYPRDTFPPLAPISNNNDAITPSLGDAASAINMFSLDWTFGFLPDRYRGKEIRSFSEYLLAAL